MIGSRVGSRSAFSGAAIGSVSDDEGLKPTTLTVALADSIDPAITSGLHSYTVIVTNTGSETAVGVSAYVTLDTQTTYISASGTGWTISHSAGVLTCNIASVAPGPAATITINVRASATPETSVQNATATAVNATPVNDSESTTVELVSFDATAQIFVPADATEWGRFRTFYGLSVATPDGLWLCQDAAGNLAPAIGATGLTAVTSPLYQQVAPTWSRLGVAGDDATGDRFNIPVAVAPNPTTASQTWVVFTYAGTVPTANRHVMGINITSFALGCRLLVVTPAVPLVLQPGCVGASNNGTADHGIGNHVFGIKYDRTNSLAIGYSELDAQATTYSAGINDGPKGFGGGASAWGGLIYTYCMMWTGAPAEISSANMKALFQAHGFTVAW